MPTWRKFNLLLEAVDLDEPMGHPILVDIHFDHKGASTKQIFYNEIFPPIIKKHKIIDPIQKPISEFLVATAPHKKLTRLF